MRVKSNRYRQLGIRVLGHDLLRDGGGAWVVSEINAGDFGGLFRLEYLGVSGITDRLVDWLCRFAERARGTVGRPAVDPCAEHWLQFRPRSAVDLAESDQTPRRRDSQ